MDDATVPDLSKIKRSKNEKKPSKDDSNEKEKKHSKGDSSKRKKKHSRDDLVKKKSKKHKDNSTKKKSKKSKHNEGHAEVKKRKHNHPEDEAETVAKKRKVQEKPVEEPPIATTDIATDKVISDSDSDSEQEQVPNQTAHNKKNYVVESNRILPALHRVYDDDVDLKTKMKGRGMVYAKIKVNRDYYMSDSDEESDSDDEYAYTKYEWHAAKSNDGKKVKKMVDSGEWPIKTGRFTVDELLRLEKRIKKIGRRHNLTLPQLRETILEDKPGKHALFWQQIVKVFPDRSLFHVCSRARKGYNEVAYKGSWSKEEDEELLRLVEMYDRKFVVIGKEMGRSDRACSERYRQLTNKIDGKKLDWTKEEFERLEKAVDEYKKKHGSEISWDHIAKEHFEGKRSALQLRIKWNNDRKYHDSATVVVRGMKDVTLKVQLALFERMQKKNWASEDLVKWSELSDETFSISKQLALKTYFKMRDALPGFERMKYRDIIDRLVETRRAMVASLED
ncbi:hypothetical protein BJV82DRAFT_709812 [Fennellomyces sp. T-0311]|nr:hypothetical protein BJV82DRAFT_709812 [Fennellomyces sp. T-0311]